MKGKLVITRMPRKPEVSGHKAGSDDSVISALYEEGNLVEIHCDSPGSLSLLNNIYIGKVKNIVANIQAAFIEIADGIVCYYSFEDNKHPIFTSVKTSQKLKAGDELLVQVSKENMKTKAPVITSNLNFTGKYIVLTSGNTHIGISNKIAEPRRTELKKLVTPLASDEYGFVVRTNARESSDMGIMEEAARLITQFQTLKQEAMHRTCFSLLYQAQQSYLSDIRDSYTDRLDEIITDDGVLYEHIQNYLTVYQREDLSKLKFYEDTLLPLKKLYSLETSLRDAVRERVWLKSGAYLVIQPTEAFVVIDVNTGKFTGKKNLRETFLKINLEAAAEIAKQLRLRNLSGIIVVDFIDLEHREDQHILMETFDRNLSKDPVKTTLVGISKLNLVELTRKKVRRPLREQLTYVCPECGGSGYIY